MILGRSRDEPRRRRPIGVSFLPQVLQQLVALQQLVSGPGISFLGLARRCCSLSLLLSICRRLRERIPLVVVWQDTIHIPIPKAPWYQCIQLSCENKVAQGSEEYLSFLRFCHSLLANLLVETPNIFLFSGKTDLPRWARLTRKLLWRAQFYPKRGRKRKQRWRYSAWMRALAHLAPDPSQVPKPR